MTAGAAPARAARRGRPAAWPAPEGQGACLGGQAAEGRPPDGDILAGRRLARGADHGVLSYDAGRGAEGGMP